jgi:hypothetical protein
METKGFTTLLTPLDEFRQCSCAINPYLERFCAKRAGAKTTEIASSHVSFLSHPREVAKVIENAAK